MKVCCSFALAAALGPCLCAHAYDIHLKSLTPVKELAKPAGGVMKFVENGELKFCVALDPKAETRVKNRTKKSIAPALVHLTNAIFRTTGKMPDVVDENDSAALEKHRYWLVLGDSKLARKAGVDVSKMPTEGFAVKTFARGAHRGLQHVRSRHVRRGLRHEVGRAGLLRARLGLPLVLPRREGLPLSQDT